MLKAQRKINFYRSVFTLSAFSLEPSALSVIIAAVKQN